MYNTLVSVGLPVRNAARSIENVVRSVLAQDHERIELVISDNASTDETEDVCRRLAKADPRIVYHRQRKNVGILNNFVTAIRLAKGTFFRWIGDDDWIAPNYVSRCLDAFNDDERLILVTTQIQYTAPDGKTHTRPYNDLSLRANDPIDRLDALVGHLIHGMPVDPAYALMRREVVAAIPRRNMIAEDQVFASTLLLKGPWGHVGEVLAHRHLSQLSLPRLARHLGVPGWQAHLYTPLQCLEMMRVIRTLDLSPAQHRRARAAVWRLLSRREYARVSRQFAKVVGHGNS
jgi:hypothetical protein